MKPENNAVRSGAVGAGERPYWVEEQMLRGIVSTRYNNPALAEMKDAMIQTVREEIAMGGAIARLNYLESKARLQR